jgi:2-polyprenyl-6-methoxyphenol hydroxylase-like FAD-dependent oxidoreductase
MRNPRALIIGGGQSGLVLGAGLLRDGWHVDLFNQGTPEDVRTGPPSVTQLTFPTTRLTEEKDFGLDQWTTSVEEQADTDGAELFRSIRLTMAPDGQAPMSFTGRLSEPGRIIDHTVKASEWLQQLKDEGARLHYKTCTDSDLVGFASTKMHDLIVVSVGGQGGLGALFEPDPSRTSGATEKAIVQAHYLNAAPGQADVDVITTPHGEVFVSKVLSKLPKVARPTQLKDFDPVMATCVQVFARPGSPLDPRGNALKNLRRRRAIQDNPHAFDATLQDVLRQYAPEVAARLQGAHMLPNSALVTELVPSTRWPVRIIAGRPIIAIGDASLMIDPTSGQGADASTGSAATLRRQLSTLTPGPDGFLPVTEDFLNRTYDMYWNEHGQYTSVFSQMVTAFWSGDLPHHILDVFGQAATDQSIADQWVAGFDNPASLDWLLQS